MFYPFYCLNITQNFRFIIRHFRHFLIQLLDYRLKTCMVVHRKPFFFVIRGLSVIDVIKPRWNHCRFGTRNQLLLSSISEMIMFHTANQISDGSLFRPIYPLFLPICPSSLFHRYSFPVFFPSLRQHEVRTYSVVCWQGDCLLYKKMYEDRAGKTPLCAFSDNYGG